MLKNKYLYFAAFLLSAPLVQEESLASPESLLRKYGPKDSPMTNIIDDPDSQCYVNTEGQYHFYTKPKGGAFIEDTPRETPLINAATEPKKTYSLENFFSDPSNQCYVRVEANYPFYSELEGSAFVENRAKKVVFTDVAFGVKRDNFALEIEETYYNDRYSKEISEGAATNPSHFTTHYQFKYFTTLINGYWFFKNQFAFDSFVGAGIGVSYFKNGTYLTYQDVLTSNQIFIDSSMGKNTNIDFAFQVFLGASKKINKNFLVESKLKWFSPGNYKDRTKPNISNPAKRRLNTIVASLGLKYAF